MGTGRGLLDQHVEAREKIREWEREDAKRASWCRCATPLHSGRFYMGDASYEQCDRCRLTIRVGRALAG